MANRTSEKTLPFPGSNLQICFVNEHHQTSESSDSDAVGTMLAVLLDAHPRSPVEYRQFERTTEINGRIGSDAAVCR